MGRQTSVEIRELVIKLYKEGKSQREIAKLVNKSRGTIQHIIHRFTRDGRIANKEKTSSKKAFSERDEAFIVREIKKNPRLSAPKLTEMVKSQLDIHVNPETVRRVLRKRGYNGRVARKKPFISNVNRQKRLEFARKYIAKDMNFWQRVYICKIE